MPVLFKNSSSHEPTFQLNAITQEGFPRTQYLNSLRGAGNILCLDLGA